MMTLLAIDDDPRSLALIAATVEQDGLEVLTCDDPERAIEIVRQRLPRVVICDLVMPKLSGMQVLHEIITIDPTIEVILLTGHYSAETAVEAIRDGAYDYLTKPVDPDRLRPGSMNSLPKGGESSVPLDWMTNSSRRTSSTE